MAENDLKTRNTVNILHDCGETIKNCFCHHRMYGHKERTSNRHKNPVNFLNTLFAGYHLLCHVCLPPSCLFRAAKNAVSQSISLDQKRRPFRPVPLSDDTSIAFSPLHVIGTHPANFVPFVCHFLFITDFPAVSVPPATNLPQRPALTKAGSTGL